MKTIFLNQNKSTVKRVYSKEQTERMEKLFGAAPLCYSKEEVLADPQAFCDTEFIFSTWGMPAFSEEEIKLCFPRLRALFYGAGTVQQFARPFLNCGVKVFSAWAANAVPVAEFTLAQILLANAGFFGSSICMSRGETEAARTAGSGYLGNYDVTVGIIGAGMIGKKVIELLRPFRIKTLVFDPFLSDETAAELGTERVSLCELFERCEVISNHLADNAQTRGMLDYSLFSKMKKNATFINTGRGAQVVEADLVRVLCERSDIFALLDVTEPEPPVANSPFYALQNCILTPHIAGSKGNEVHRMAEYMLTEYESYISGKPCLYEVTSKMLETMA